MNTEDYEKNLNDASKNTSDFEKKIKTGLNKVANAVKVGLAAATTAVTGFAVSSIKAGAEFDSSMSQVAATMGTTVDKIQELRDFAMDMGAKTAFSATQAADALNYMALAGYDADESMQALPNVLNLAAAGGIELAAASDMVTDAQSALGLSMEESAELVDKMAKTASKSNTSVAQLGEAILTVGGTAKNLAGGTTELSTALGILADNGIKGAEGGTTLRNVILSLSAPTDTAAKAMKNLGLEVYDADGNMRPLNETFSDLDAVLSTMTQGEQTQVLNEIFNKVDLKGVNALLSNTGDRFDELTGYINDSAGAAENMASTQLDNFAGDVTLLKSAVEGVQIAFSDKLSPALREGTQFLTELAGKVQSFIQEGGVEKIVQLFTDLAPAIAGVTSAVIAYKAAMAISAIVDAASQAIQAFKLANEGATVSQMLLNAVMNANPFVLVATLIASVGAALVTLYMTNEDFRNKVQEIWEKIKEIFSNAWEFIKGVWDAVEPYFSALWDSITKVFSVAKDFFGDVFSAAWNAIGVVWDKAKGYFQNIWNTIKGIFSAVKSVLSGDFSGAWEAIKNVLAGWGDYFRDLWDTVKNIFSGVKDWFFDVGKNLLEGLWNGIKDKVEWLKSKVTGVVDTIKGWFTGKDGFDEHSPSKWSNQVFRYVMEGGGEGLESGLPGLMGDVSNVVNKVKSGMDFGTTSVDFSASAAGITSAEIANSISSAATTEGATIPLTINLLTGDGYKFAQWVLPDLIRAADAAGTPIASEQYA